MVVMRYRRRRRRRFGGSKTVRKNSKSRNNDRSTVTRVISASKRKPNIFDNYGMNGD
jgi:hypothetical protein